MSILLVLYLCIVNFKDIKKYIKYVKAMTTSPAFNDKRKKRGKTVVVLSKYQTPAFLQSQERVDLARDEGIWCVLINERLADTRVKKSR